MHNQWCIVRKNAYGKIETFRYFNWEQARVQIQALHALETVWYQVFVLHNGEWTRLDMPWMY